MRILGRTVWLTLALLPGVVHATNGYSPTGFGTTNKGLAGAGVALPQDTLAAATNPAGMVRLPARMDVGAALFIPNRGFTADPNGPQMIQPGQYDSANDLFLVPHFGYNRPLDAVSSIGLSLGGNGGMNTEYNRAVWKNFAAPAGTAMNPTGFFSATSPTGVDLAQLFLGLTYARKLSDTQSLGIMPIIAFQRFKAEGLEPFRQFSVAPNSVSNNGYDQSWGYGLRVGWLGGITDRLSAGVSYQSKLHMQKFDKYKGLFAEQGDFDVPSTVTAGLAYQATSGVTVLLDYQRIFYGQVKSLSNANDLDIRTDPTAMLGADGGLGFGWKNINIYKLGVQWEYSPSLTLRAGVSHADKLFDNGQALFNVLAPATVRDHASLGLTYRYAPNSSIAVAYTRAFSARVRGQNTVFTGLQTGSVQMDQHELELSWGHQF